MTADRPRLDHAGVLLQELAAATQACVLYPPGHPGRSVHAEHVVAAVRALDAADNPHPTVFVAHGCFYLGGTLLPAESLRLDAFGMTLDAAGVESLRFLPSLQSDELEAFVETLHLGRLPVGTANIHVNAVRLSTGSEEDTWSDRMQSLRSAYAQSLDVLRRTARRVASGQPVDLGAATTVVEALADAVARDPGYGLLLSAVKSYDEYTYFHMVNVSLLSVSLGQAIGLRRDQVLVLGLGGLLHDIGKVHVPPEILRGDSKLDEEQWRIVQRHPVEGAGHMLATSEGLHHPAAAVILEHHAAYDGSGYPRIDHRPSVASRLVAVADCFDAVTSRRSYREPLSRPEAVRILRSAAGRGLDPTAVAAFIALLGKHPPGSLVQVSSGETCLVVSNKADEPERPRVLVLLDATGTPVEVGERDLSEQDDGPIVTRRVDADEIGLDLSRFVVTGEVRPVEPHAPARGLVHEPSPGEVHPDGYVDTHAHGEPHSHAPMGTRPDPDVAPPIVLAGTGPARRRVSTSPQTHAVATEHSTSRDER